MSFLKAGSQIYQLFKHCSREFVANCPTLSHQKNEQDTLPLKQVVQLLVDV